MPKADVDFLKDALEHLRVLHAHLSADSADDQLVIDAVALRLAAAIDSLDSVVDDVRKRELSDDEWRVIKSMRNRIAHAYVFFDAAVLRSTISSDIAGFESKVRRMYAYALENAATRVHRQSPYT